MEKSHLSRVAWAALGALVLFQALVLVLWPGGAPWVLVLGGVGLDLLVGFFTWSASFRVSSGEAQALATLERTSLESFEATKNQAIDRLSSLAQTGALDPEAGAELLAEVDVLRRLETSSGVDALQAAMRLNTAVDQQWGAFLSRQANRDVQLRSARRHNRLSHYRLTEAVAFLTAMGDESSRYSETIVLEVLTTFREITQLSQDIGTEVAGKVRHLMDPGNAEGLDAIHRESTGIQHSVEELMAELTKVNGYTEKAVVDNLDRMQRVQTMAGAIGEFSENIRMISLNLNIEAARASQQSGGNRKSFQVLAAKLSEFATRAGELARQQEEAIADAVTVVTETGRAQREKTLELLALVSPIKGRLDPFARIVDQTFHEFGLVEASMSQLSTSIDERLKAVLGRFQFQDLARQEQEHILAMVAHIRDLADQEGGEDLDEGQKLQAWQDLILKFEKIATTENERQHIELSRKSGSVSTEEQGDSRLAAGSVSLF